SRKRSTVHPAADDGKRMVGRKIPHIIGGMELPPILSSTAACTERSRRTSDNSSRHLLSVTAWEFRRKRRISTTPKNQRKSIAILPRLHATASHSIPLVGRTGRAVAATVSGFEIEDISAPCALGVCIAGI